MNYTCYNRRIIPNTEINPILYCEDVPKAYVVRSYYYYFSFYALSGNKTLIYYLYKYQLKYNLLLWTGCS